MERSLARSLSQTQPNTRKTERPSLRCDPRRCTRLCALPAHSPSAPTPLCTCPLISSVYVCACISTTLACNLACLQLGCACLCVHLLGLCLLHAHALRSCCVSSTLLVVCVVCAAPMCSALLCVCVVLSLSAKLGVICA